MSRGFPGRVRLAALTCDAGSARKQHKFAESYEAAGVDADRAGRIAEKYAKRARQERVAEQRNWLLRGLGAIVLGTALHTGDKLGHLCLDPDSWFQGHAAWHVLGAVAMLAAYRCMRAENLPVHSHMGKGGVVSWRI